MENYSAMIRNTFELCSIRDGQVFFETCLKNAFPTFNFRRLELIRIDRDNLYLEGRSWNHVFERKATTFKGSPVWDVSCRRVTMGSAPEKRVYLDYMTLGFLQYNS